VKRPAPPTLTPESEALWPDRLPPACQTRDTAVSHPADTIPVGLLLSWSRQKSGGGPYRW